MTVAASVRYGRRRAETLMTARCTIDRATGTETVGYRLVPVMEQVYEGRCKLQTYEGNTTRAGQPSGGSVVVQSLQVHIPVGAAQVLPGDVVTIIQSRDPLLVGREFRVTQAWPLKEHATAYRIGIEEPLLDEGGTP